MTIEQLLRQRSGNRDEQCGTRRTLKKPAGDRLILVNNISLPHNPEHIEGKVSGVQIARVAQRLKKGLSSRELTMYKLVFFVPESHLEPVKAAVFATGAGRIGDYAQCCFETRGQGQFRPLAGADPFLGHPGELERVAEVRVELVCEDRLIRDAVAALRAAHPYEEPAFDAWPLAEL